MSSSNQAVSRQVPVIKLGISFPLPRPSYPALKSNPKKNSRIQERQHLSRTRDIPPIPHQIHRDAKHAHKMDTRILHASIGVRSEFIREGARSVGVGENFVAFGTEGEGEKGCTCEIFCKSRTTARKKG